MKTQRIFSLIAAGLALIGLFLPAINVSYLANSISFNLFGSASTQLGELGNGVGLSSLTQSAAAWLVIGLLIVIVVVASWGWREAGYDRSSQVLQGGLFLLVALSAVFVIVDVQMIRSFLSTGLSDLIRSLSSLSGEAALENIPAASLAVFGQIQVEVGIGIYLILLACLVGFVSIFLPSGSAASPQVLYPDMGVAPQPAVPMANTQAIQPVYPEHPTSEAPGVPHD